MEGSSSLSSNGTNDSERKKKKLQEVNHISSLPDSILIHILSLLPTTKDAIKTGILSKRWLYLWTHLPTLIFRFNAWYLKPRKVPNFTGHVDKTLLFISSSKLKKFHLFLDHYTSEKLLLQLGSGIEIWIRFTVLRHVEELILELEPFVKSPGYLLPQFFYVNHCLSQLKTKFCSFVPNGKVEWISLRVLEISHSTLSNETIDKIIFGSPLLEYLKLSQCVGIQNLDISSKSLKSLVLDRLYLNVKGREYLTFVITAPFLQNLDILGGCYFKWKLSKMSSLMSATLDFNITKAYVGIGYEEICSKVVIELLNEVRHAKELKFGSWCIEVVSTWEKSDLNVPFLDCNFLVLKTPSINKWTIPGMASLVQSSYKHEKLMIDLSWNNSERFKNCRQCYAGDYAFSHLKTIEFFSFYSTPCEQEAMYEFLEFLLKNAHVLQKMIIQYRDESWKTENMLLIANKLLNFPRSSRNAIIVHC